MTAQPKVRAWPSRAANGRTYQKVRRNSREALTTERADYLTPRQRGERLAAFRRQAHAARPKGKRRGSGSSYSLYCEHVLAYLMGHAVRNGRVFPSYDQIRQAVGCAYKTAVSCVRQLRRGGWLTWERRFVRIANGGALEPQVHQATNLYTLTLPTAAGQLIAAWKARQAPPPADVPDEWAASFADADAEAGLRRAVAEAERDAQRRNQHLISKLAAARTPSAVVHVLTQAQRTAELLDQMGAALEAKAAGRDRGQREFPQGSEAPEAGLTK